MSNQQIQDGTEALPANLKVAVNDTQTYLETTKKELTNLLDGNYKQFDSKIQTLLTSKKHLCIEYPVNIIDNCMNNAWVIQCFE